MSDAASSESRSTTGAAAPPHLQATGLSALELAAQRGLGPLSELGERAWHGEARPCVSCGQLMRRTQEICPTCGQDLSGVMITRMRQHCGPWYVLEHVRPFPGVSLERLIRQIRRSVLTRTTIVRGPTTYHQWRFAAETPVLCKYLGCCWSCQAEVTEHDHLCPTCRADLNDGFTNEGTEPATGPTAPLEQLSQAIGHAPAPVRRRAAPAGATVGRLRASWIVAGLMLLVIVAVFVIVQLRTGTTVPAPGQPAPTAAPAVPAPAEVPTPLPEP